MSPDDLGVHVNKHLAKRMFLVGLTISAADVICHLVLAESFKEMMDFQKIGLNHAFRWLDHMQHLPGMSEQVDSLGLFVSFPDETQSQPSKAQLKKLEKIQAAKNKKAEKKDGKQPEEKK